MRNPRILVDNFVHTHAAKCADVERLTAGGWIKRSAVQIDAPKIRARVNDTSPEFGQIAVVVIQAIGH